jgi:rhodanese-related sulfurtransferase
MKKILCIILFTGVVQAFSAYHPLSADTLSKWITNGPPFSFILIDVRDTSEVDTVMGTSLCRPYHMSLNQGVFAANYSLVPKAGNVIVYCRSGNRSATAATTLDNAGYPNVYAMSSGFSTWKGPKQPRAGIRSLSDLPANSMTATSAIILKKNANTGRLETYTSAYHFLSGNRVIISRKSSGAGDSRYYYPNGQALRTFRNRR